ncbi:MAG TPA: S8 family serine peptidase, partial [Verrucomicrobiae bacterium]|nr:S8 family serine peptidase [Verrucomicrobiae bacterium]
MPARTEEKRILLRNETIVTAAPNRRALQAQVAQEPANGLYLIQLENNPPAEWRRQLESLHVQLLRPVPEDAFVADFQGASLAQVRSLPFVRWVGPYRPEHKTQTAVRQLATIPEEKRVRVTALLSFKASGIDTAILQRLFRPLTKYDKTRFGSVLEGEISTRSLKVLIDSRAVLWVEPAPKRKLHDAVAVQIIGGASGANSTGIEIQDLGFDGKGVTVAVADSGLDAGEEPLHPDITGRVDAFLHYGSLTDAADEHGHGTHVAGIIAGNGASGETDESGFLYGLGVAPKAHLIAQRIFDGVGNFEPPASNAQLTKDAIHAGADIGSNSWGDDVQGRYNTDAMEFDALVRDADPDTPGDQPYILEFSAGNAGPGDKTIDSPAVAKNVIATGASENNRFDFFIYADGQESMADFSSRGPCEDGRIKPDLVAPGTWIASLQSSAATDENAWLGISELYQYEGGTSQAGPHASGAAAVFVQYYRETHQNLTPSPALVKAALINSAVDMDNTVPLDQGGTSYTPNNDEGWGRIDLTELLGGERKFDYTDESALLKTGDIFEKHLVIASFDQPLKITLAYTDVPGFPPAIPALVNDLDLEVISPSGIVYHGNQFIEGESAPNPSSFDSINNVEGVAISFPEPGEYIVRVIGRKVVEDSRKDTVAIDQDFALVFSGDVPIPGQGVIAMDQRAYNVPATINLKLIDLDLASLPNATIHLTSSSETNGLAVVLNAVGNNGVFTGGIQTASLPVANDGKLHVKQDDQIEATYQDASPANTVTASAHADLIPPVITEINATNQFGKEAISWTTDEPARSVVYYGTNSVFVGLTNSLLKTDHSVTLGDLQAGQTYRFFVVSIDEAGNTSTNNNNGAFYSFVAKPAATVLVVNAYSSVTNGESIDIPITAYTDALDRTGVSYEVWNVASAGSPTAADLDPFRVVIWRINDSFWTADTISSGQQGAITNYLAKGGSFLLSSAEILTRVGLVPFRTNVLQVAEFKQADPANMFETCPDCDEDHGVSNIVGSDLDSVTSGISMPLDYSQYPILEQEPFAPNIGPDVSDIFTPTTNAVPILFDPDGNVVGIKYPRTGQEGTGRVVFLSFPLDTVPMDGPAPNNRPNLLRNLLSFLAPGVNGLGTISLDSGSYTVPSKVTIEVADSDLAGRSNITVTVTAKPSDRSTTADLQATVQSGVFRGFVTLVSTNEPPSSGRLPVSDGDTITAEYLDASTSTKVQGRAEVDLVLPRILNVQVKSDYENATISWETSEPTDALVQFGESKFLGKTVYRGKLETAHSLSLAALVPDRIYYFQMASRDEAGNTAIDDNDTNLYSFRTLKPLNIPWSDNMENGAAGWTVQNGDDIEGQWTLGTPNNSIATSAHSGTNAWGTNLKGGSASYVDSFLISPAVELTGGNVASLKFWQNYDFTQDATIESASLVVFTNSQTLPITLGSYSDASPGWAEETIDLTPYVGHVIQLAWQYQLLDYGDGTAFPGWLIDDVRIDITNVVYGTIRITN